ncbi:MAG TPA: hypothetical protein VG966_07600 [Hyphomicrobiaceae bacterium]|nr:hypothetical protein [Hyphomicrobiaceae bacterium]
MLALLQLPNRTAPRLVPTASPRGLIEIDETADAQGHCENDPHMEIGLTFADQTQSSDEDERGQSEAEYCGRQQTDPAAAKNAGARDGDKKAGWLIG